VYYCGLTVYNKRICYVIVTSAGVQHKLQLRVVFVVALVVELVDVVEAHEVRLVEDGELRLSPEVGGVFPLSPQRCLIRLLGHSLDRSLAFPVNQRLRTTQRRFKARSRRHD